MSNDKLGDAIHRLWRWFTKREYEKACGCVHYVEKTPLLPKDEPATELLDDGLRTIYTEEYVNATVYHNEFWAKHRCQDCGGVYEKTRKGGRKTAYSEPNPDASKRLKVDHRPGFGGGVWIHQDEPVVKNDG